MPTFAYTARDSAGAQIAGTIVADDVAEASRLIRAEGRYPIHIRPATDSASAASTAAGAKPDIKLPRADVIQISTQLSVMLETGVPLAEALECIAVQCSKPAMRRLVEDLSEQVQGGSDFSSALARHPRSFPTLFIAMMRASEKSGMMSKLLVRATNYLRDEQETARRVRGALTYPAIMFAFALLATLFLLVFVLPRFTRIYAAKAAALPLPTRILVAVSDFVTHNWLWLTLGTITAIVATVLFFRSATGRRPWHYIQLNVPILGALARKLFLTRSLRMIGTMGNAGINLLDCVSSARDLTPNLYFRDLWDQVSDQIQHGRQLSEAMFRSPLVPRGVAQMLSSGEKGGKLSAVMEQVATFSEQELKEKIADLTRYIEPAMIVFMGILIGGVALALLLPIFSISKVMSQ